MDRRDALKSLAGLLAAALPGAAESQSATKSSRLGLVSFCSRYRRAWLKANNKGFDLYEPGNYLAYCLRLGAGGMQTRLGVLSEKAAGSLQKTAERGGLFIEGIVSLPMSARDLSRFDAELQTAKRCGATAVRTVMIPGRRYEQYKSLAEFRAALARGRRMLQRAAPVAEKHRVRLAVENHKDQRSDSRVKLLKQIGSEYVGACVDTGNSIALLEDPLETAEQLAPFAFTVHLKDQAVREHADGFLLADIPLGQGMIDLKKVVGILRKRKPDVRFSLELITRDPLQVPCLAPRYWAAMPDLDARHLAKMLRMVRAKSAKSLATVESLPLRQQLEREDANVRQSLAYARRHLDL